MSNPTTILHNEMEEALLNLARDKNYIGVTLDKAQALAIFVTVQFASTHPVDDDLKALAIFTAKRIGDSLSQNDEIIKNLVEAGWRRIKPSFPLPQITERMEQLAREEFRFVLSKLEAWALMRAIQLAVKHKHYAKTPAAEYCERVMRSIIDRAIDNNLLRVVADSGWDTRYDC